MEKEMNQQQLNELIQDWTEDKLPAAEENEITDRILDFVENDDEEIDVEEFLDLHIHQLAEEEGRGGRSKWKIFVASVAAASVVLLAIATTFILTQENGQNTDTEILALERSAEGTSTAIDLGLPTTMAEAADGRIDHSSKGQELRRSKKRICHDDSTIAKTRKNGSTPKHREEKTMKLNKEMPELILAETLAEIKAGLVSMADNTMESLNMTNECLVPVNMASDEYEPNIIETNLINAIYEIRTLNIKLNFETDNKTTEI